MRQDRQLTERWNRFWAPAMPVIKKVGHIVYQIGLWIYRLRAVIMAIPVVVLALRLARMNYGLLPETVGIGLQANGAYAYLVTKQVAVYGPLAVTALCLLMVALSKKTIYPWIISLFSLALPVVILLINVFPA